MHGLSTWQCWKPSTWLLWIKQKATVKTIALCTQLLDYLLHIADANIQFHASNMILTMHSDASYLLEPKAQSHACGHFFMGWKPKNGEPICLNGAFHVSLRIMKFVVASAAEAKLSMLYHNCQTSIIFQLTLAELGHLQLKTFIHCKNTTTVGIANNLIKRQHSRSMEMLFFWVGDKIAQNMYNLSWHPGQENLAAYQSKHHLGSHHVNIRPWYSHMENSLRYLPGAKRPSTLKGCVGTLKDGYKCNIPLPRAPRVQSASFVTSMRQVTTVSQDTY